MTPDPLIRPVTYERRVTFFANLKRWYSTLPILILLIHFIFVSRPAGPDIVYFARVLNCCWRAI